MTTVYETAREHLRDELQVLDIQLRTYLKQWYQERESVAEPFHGLYISDEEVVGLLREPVESEDPPREASGRSVGDRSNQRAHLNLEAEQCAADIDDRVQASLAAGVDLRLPTVAERFGLDAAHVDVLLFALAPELDSSYERIYAYLQDDMTRQRPSVGLALSVLFPDEPDCLRVRSLMNDTSPLVTHRLVRRLGSDEDPLLTRALSVDERVVSYLLGEESLSAETGIRTRTPVATVASLWVDTPVERALDGLTTELKRDDQQDLLVSVYGPTGAPTGQAVDALCSATNRALVIVDIQSLEWDSGLEETLGVLRREVMLRDAALRVDNVDTLEMGDQLQVLRGLDRIASPVFLTGETRFGGQLRSALEQHRHVEVELPRPSYRLQQEMWAAESLPAGVDPGELATKFAFTPGQVAATVATARSLAIAEGEPGKVTAERVYEACRAQTDDALGSLARKLEPHYTWDDIVLPTDRLTHLQEVEAYIDQRGRVYHEWGFEERFSLGKGLVVLFTGPSGTGKTMAADIIAGNAGVDLYKVDLAGVVSKYIGETEKNLGKVFDEAAGSNAILLFDEADALFGKRSEVADAHDRYANIEVNYLLQRIEEYDGTVILTTNFDGNIDDAFRRRIHATVEFPLPDEPARRAIWRTIFPSATPVENLDVEFLATLRLSGGNIKNAALTAAVLAAEAGVSVNMNHLARATRRELQKNGTLVDPMQFETYLEGTVE